MARGNRKLTARAAATLKPGRHGDGDGVHLIVSPSGARKWVYRFTFDGRVTGDGSRSAAVVTLAEARDKAQAARKLRDTGEDPSRPSGASRMKTAGRTRRSALWPTCSSHRRKQNGATKSIGPSGGMTLAHYAAPLRSRPVSEIGTEAVLAILTPIWQAKPETASRLRGRIELFSMRPRPEVIDRENPARWRGHLSHLLFNHGRLIRGHHAAMPYA